MKKEEPSFESKIAELELILDKMASEETTLEQSIALYAKAAALIQETNETLNGAQLQIREIDQKLAQWDESKEEQND